MIRLAELSDAAGIAAVHVATWQHAYAGIIDADYLANISVAQRTERWQRILGVSGDGTRATLVAVTPDREIAGHVSYGPSRDDDVDATQVCEIYSIYVEPSMQGAGVGKELLQGALGSLPPTCMRVTLWVLTDNCQARTFYEGQGFVVDGAQQDAVIGEQRLCEVRYALLR